MEKLLSCPICHEPFTQAVEVSCCSKCYCLHCIEKWLQDAGSEKATCPSCRSPLAPGQWKDNKPLQALADDLPIVCKYASNGCQASITRGISKEHESKCDYASTPCPSENCPAKLLRKDISLHLETCAYKQIGCVLGCGVLVRAAEVQKHFQDCPLFLLACAYCGLSFPRKDMPDHSNNCSYSSTCPFAEYGCKEGKILDLDAHLTQNMASHFVYSCNAIRRLQDSNKSLQEQVDSLSAALKEFQDAPPTIRPTLPALTDSSEDVVAIKQSLKHAQATLPLTSSDTKASESKNDGSFDSSAPLKPVPGSSPSPAPNEKAAELQQLPSTALEIGLKLVSALPPEAQPAYSKLVNRPQLMLECLIMNQRFDCLQALFEFMPSVFREELFFTYAKKALSLSNTNYEAQIKVGLETIRGPTVPYKHETIMLTGDAIYDEELRRKHVFPDPPNSDLALKILSYCDDIKAGYFTVQLCESFDGYVTGFASYELNVRTITALKSMLQFGKVLFLKHPVEAHSGIIELCDSFLSQLDLMLQIVNCKKPIQACLADFAEPNKARTLRDRLIELGEYEAARDLCLRTNTPVEVVTVAWALNFIKQGKYPEARQMLQHLLVPTSLSVATAAASSARGSGLHHRKSSAHALSNPSRGVDTQMIVDNIVQILDAPLPAAAMPSSGPNAPPRDRAGSSTSASSSSSRPRSGSGSGFFNGGLFGKSSSSSAGTKATAPSSPSIASSSDDIRRRTVDVVSSKNPTISKPAEPMLPLKLGDIGTQNAKPAPQPLLLTPALEECLFYLEKYGSTSSLLKFCMKHTLLDRACERILNERVDADIFLERIVIPCSDNSLLSELKNALERVDPQQKRCQPYLMATCKYLNEQKAFKTLVIFQIFMKDYVRAGLTCIRVFMDTSDSTYRVKCLEIAKDYFNVALKELSSQAPPSPSSTSSGASSGNVMSASDMSSYIMKIDIQLEVLKVLSPLLPKLSALPNLSALAEYSLFGSPTQRSTIAWILMVYKLDLGLRVLTDTIKKEEWPNVFTNAGIHAARHLPVGEATQLIENVKAAGADIEWQDLLRKAEVEVLALEKKDFKTSETLAKTIHNPRLRCLALVDAGKLKSAYLDAVKLDDPLALIASILTRAEKDNDQSVIKLCTNFVMQHNAKLQATAYAMQK